MQFPDDPTVIGGREAARENNEDDAMLIGTLSRHTMEWEPDCRSALGGSAAAASGSTEDGRSSRRPPGRAAIKRVGEFWTSSTAGLTIRRTLINEWTMDWQWIATFAVSTIAAIGSAVAATFGYTEYRSRQRERTNAMLDAFKLTVGPHEDEFGLHAVHLIYDNRIGGPAALMRMDVLKPRGAMLFQQTVDDDLDVKPDLARGGSIFFDFRNNGGLDLGGRPDRNYGTTYRYVKLPKPSYFASSVVRLTLRLTMEETSSRRRRTVITVTSQPIEWTASKNPKTT